MGGGGVSLVRPSRLKENQNSKQLVNSRRRSQAAGGGVKSPRVPITRAGPGVHPSALGTLCPRACNTTCPVGRAGGGGSL